jgi:hypothetical protein
MIFFFDDENHLKKEKKRKEKKKNMSMYNKNHLYLALFREISQKFHILSCILKEDMIEFIYFLIIF